MLWLGLTGRRKISSLDAEIARLDEKLDRLAEDFRTLDLEMTSHLDRLNGIAKRITGRKGGRPPSAQPNGHAEGNSEPDDGTAIPPTGFTRHAW